MDRSARCAERFLEASAWRNPFQFDGQVTCTITAADQSLPPSHINTEHSSVSVFYALAGRTIPVHFLVLGTFLLRQRGITCK
jgi:hypothetical protein